MLLRTRHAVVTSKRVAWTVRQRLLLARRGHFSGVSLNFLEKSNVLLHPTPGALVECVFEAATDDIREHAQDVVRRACDSSPSEDLLPAPDRWNAGSEGLLLLALITLLRRPTNVVEVGVANGYSTRTVLTALSDLNSGTLTSFDIDKRCSAVVTRSQAQRWDFQLLPTGFARAALGLKSSISSLPPADLWFSDADHSYAWQRYEWNLAIASLGSDGVIVADDVDATPAWSELAGPIERHAIVDTRRVVGVGVIGQR